ncbi:MAG TPA: DegT/DnrJ/EryC1/StrS aminotransferase family protein [Candidatus Acidoferrum sp.]|nr:DegT/DnrJ/EryC1/StrS aminotransferase family protein [Candidatus Acidoferrum sp.]
MTVVTPQFVPFSRALIEEDEISAVVDVLRSGWLTTGARVREFESAFARYTGATHAVAVSSCTAALHLALAATNLKAGDEVIIPAMTFASTGEVVCYFNAQPVLVDCERGTYHLDPKEFEGAITSRTRAVIPVHFSGYARNMDAILEIARKRNITVIEDAAHALPSRYEGRMVGKLGDITCFSFYATKTLTTGEGGMVTTENEEYADRIRILSLHGISKDAWKRYTSAGSWRYDILEVGYKYNLTDIQAAIGLVQLAKCDAMQSARAALAGRYGRGLAPLDAFQTPVVPSNATSAWHLYVVNVDSSALRIDRNRVIEELKNRGVGTSVHFIPLHLHSLYQKRLGYHNGQFPNAEERFASAISIPLYAAMADEECDRVIESLHDIARIYRR